MSLPNNLPLVSSLFISLIIEPGALSLKLQLLTNHRFFSLASRSGLLISRFRTSKFSLSQTFFAQLKISTLDKFEKLCAFVATSNNS